MALPQEAPESARDYLRDFADGRYDQTAHLGYIYPAADARLTAEGHLLIGSPGADGLEFACRADAAGIWIWYPIDGDWRLVADDIYELDRAWRSGALKV